MSLEETVSKPRTGGVDAHLARHGKVSYMRIPAKDTTVAAEFYRAIFGWKIVSDNPHHRSFADASGEMIGAFVTGREVAAESGILPYIYVEGIDKIVDQVVANGGSVLEAPYSEGGLWVATFRDPAGNVMGLWQAGPR